MKNDLTAFGIYYKGLRKKYHETIQEAAEKLGVSIAYISLVEHGNREVPKEWRDKIIKQYQLSDQDIVELDNALEKTPATIKISLDEIQNMMRNFAENIARDDNEKEILLKNVESFMKQLKK